MVTLLWIVVPPNSNTDSARDAALLLVKPCRFASCAMLLKFREQNICRGAPALVPWCNKALCEPTCCGVLKLQAPPPLTPCSHHPQSTRAASSAEPPWLSARLLSSPRIFPQAISTLVYLERATVADGSPRNLLPTLNCMNYADTRISQQKSCLVLPRDLGQHL